MPGQNPSVIGTANVGDIDWIDLQNNWRQADAEWLQERSIVRVTTTPAAETTLINTNAGRVFYSVADGRLVVSVGSGNYKNVMASDGLVVADTSTTVTLSISGQSGFTFTKATGAVSIANLSISTALTATSATVTNLTARAGSNTSGLRATTSGVEINTSGSHNVVLTTSASGLVSDTGISVPSVATSGAVTVGANLTVSAGGVTSLRNTTITGTLSVSSTLNVTGATTLGAVSMATGNASTSLTTPLLRSDTGDDLTINASSGQAIRSTSNIFWGNSSTIRNAWVIYSGSDPGVNNVPEGTIWIS